MHDVTKIGAFGHLFDGQMHWRTRALTFSSIIHSREMKSRSKVTNRQKVRRTSEMALRSAGGTKRYGDGMDMDVEKEALRELMAGVPPPNSS